MVRAIGAAANQELLDQLVASTGLPRAEVIARGIRALAAKLSPLATVRSMEKLIGAFGDAPDAPTDLSERHDVYLGREIA